MKTSNLYKELEITFVLAGFVANIRVNLLLLYMIRSFMLSYDKSVLLILPALSVDTSQEKKIRKSAVLQQLSVTLFGSF